MRVVDRLFGGCLLALVTMSAAPTLAAQCGFEWQSVGGYPGADGVVECGVEWDPDGAGPAPLLAVLGGQFSVVGNAVAPHLAIYEPLTDTWAGLGGGMDGPVYALLPLPNGELLAAGEFVSAGGLPCHNVARWDGASWQALGGGVDGPVKALARLPNGELVVGGQFATAGGVAAANIARWDGTLWSPFGSGCNAEVAAMAVAATGELFVGGSFTTAGGLAAARVARWNGSWSNLGSGVLWALSSMAFDPGGDLFAVIQSSQKLVRWDGASWSVAANGLQFHEGSQALRVAPSGELMLCGRAVLGDPSLFRWSGSAWTGIASAIGGGVTSIRAFVQFGNGNYLLGGSFAAPSACVLRFVGGQRVAIQGGLEANCYDLAETTAGEIVAATTVGLRCQVVGGWQRYGPAAVGLDGVAMRASPNGGVLVAGDFDHTWMDSYGNYQTSYYACVQVLPASYVYLSTGWTTTISTAGTALTQLPSGHAVLALRQAVLSLVHVFDGSGWSGNGYEFGGPPGAVTALAAITSSTMLAAVTSGTTGSIYRLAGGTWMSIASYDGSVECLLTLPSGAVVAGGTFTSIDGVVVNHIALWDGATWNGIGTGVDGPVRAVLCLPNGDLLVGGAFQAVSGLSSPFLARWTGSAWSSLAGSPDAPVEALTQDHLGRVWVGGQFSRVGNLACGHIARLDPTCPGTTSTYGTGCNGIGGTNTLTATSLPWRDATFCSRAAGLQPSSIAVVANGFAPLAVPLSLLLPFALPGCDLLTTPDVTWLALTDTGTLDVELFLPASSVTLGQQLRQQVFGVQLDAAGNLTGLSSSNALLLTVGEL